MHPTLNFISPNWPAPAGIRAYTSTRQGGYSHAPFDSFNLAAHVGDEAVNVAKNRMLLREKLQLQQEPVWLSQVHGTKVIELSSFQIPPSLEGAVHVADASWTQTKGPICAVLTADCLPILMCDKKARWVAAIHAGWRGLVSGVVESTLAAIRQARVLTEADTLVWLGPAIGPNAFEVGPEVRDSFLEQRPDLPEQVHAFKPIAENHYLADLYALARMRLHDAGIAQVYGGEFCTYTQQEKFYSYRRDEQTGRMASLIWITS